MIRITFWGLPSAGKSSFIFSFFKSLNLYGKDMGINLIVEPLTGKTRLNFDKHYGNFSEHNILPPSSKDILRYKISINTRGIITHRTFHHKIEIVDIPGEFLDGRPEAKDYYELVSHSDAIMCFMPLHSNYEFNYAPAIFQLKNYISSKHKVLFLLSKCDNKIDLIKFEEYFYRKQVNKIFERYAPKQVFLELENLFSCNEKQYYLSSNIGWIKTVQNINYPNKIFSSSIGQLRILKPHEWRPWGILEPIFYLIDSIDMWKMNKNLREYNYCTLIQKYWEWKDYYYTSTDSDFVDWMKNRFNS